MTVSGGFEVAVGLVFTYFVFSSICSGVNEGIARVLNSRGKQLFQSINALIGDAEAAKEFWQHPLITPLIKTRWTAGTQQSTQTDLLAGITRNPENGSIESTVSQSNSKALPSYISPTTAVTAMKLVASTDPTTTAALPAPTDPRAAAVAPTGFWGVVSSFSEAGIEEEEKLQAALEKWFNDAMDRLSGSYKRFVQVILLGLAILVTVGFNVSTIRVAQELWAQPSLLASVTQEANQVVQNSGNTGNTGSTGNTGTTGSTDLTNPTTQSLNTSLNQAATLPVGWGAPNRPHGGSSWLLTVLGWLITIGALTFGAPFWFDLLSRMNSLRATGPPATTAAA